MKLKRHIYRSASVFAGAILATSVVAQVKLIPPPPAASAPATPGVVKVMGLDLGAKFPSMSICPSNTDKARSNCWIDKPFTASTGEKLGSVHFVDKQNRPAWATYASSEIVLSKSGELLEVRFTTFTPADRPTIVSSISSRFRNPYVKADSLETYWAIWSNNEVYIDLFCSNTCKTTFRTYAYEVQRMAEVEARKKKEAAKPVSP